MRTLPLALAAFGLLAGCAAPATPAADVLGTFYPLEFVASRLAGSNLTTGALVPGGIEPHDWEPAPTDVTRLAEARLVLAQGAGFEPWLDGLVANLGERAPRVVDTTAGMSLAEGGHEEDEHEEGAAAADEAVDPHTWIAPAHLARQVDAAEAALAEAWPEHAASVRERAAALRAELAGVDAEYRAGLAECEVRIIIANHDAYGYLARSYAFEVVSLSGLSPEAEPTPEALARAIEVAREHELKVVFFEELVSPRVAEIVASEVGAQTRVLSPIESAPEEGDALSLMRQNLVHLREAMRCT